MPRVYKPKPGGKRYKSYDENVIKQAVEEYLTGNDSMLTVAEKYNMHKSVLHRHSKGVTKTLGGQRALSSKTEETIIQYVNICAEWGYPLGLLDLRHIIKMYLDKLGITQRRFKDNLPGPDYIQSFLNRHKDKVSERVSQIIKRSRAIGLVKKMTKYFEELKKSLVEIPAANIINYDETNLADDPRSRRIIIKREIKYPDCTEDSNGSVSIMIAGSAEGELLPPYVVYKSQNLYNTWVSHGPKGARYNRSASGWFDGNIFEDWIRTIVIPFFADKPGKKLLIGDNLSSHLSVDMIKLCTEHEINFVFLPSNSTHLTQPLEVAFFRPMKEAWRQILLEWKETDGSSETCVPKSCFPQLLKKLMEEIQENANFNLKVSFKKTGIYPLDPTQVLSQIPKRLSNKNRRGDEVDESVINLLQEMRQGRMNMKDIIKKRKLDVVPGKSVKALAEEDYIDSVVAPGPRAPKIPKSVKNALKKENALLQERKSIKGKGAGKRTIRKINASTNKLNVAIEKNMAATIEKNKDIGDNYIVNNEHIDYGPVYLECEVECESELIIEKCEP